MNFTLDLLSMKEIKIAAQNMFQWFLKNFKRLAWSKSRDLLQSQWCDLNHYTMKTIITGGEVLRNKKIVCPNKPSPRRAIIRDNCISQPLPHHNNEIMNCENSLLLVFTRFIALRIQVHRKNLIFLISLFWMIWFETWDFQKRWPNFLDLSWNNRINEIKIIDNKPS